jgi:hypothetical protein
VGGPDRTYGRMRPIIVSLDMFKVGGCLESLIVPIQLLEPTTHKKNLIHRIRRVFSMSVKRDNVRVDRRVT